MSLNAFCCNFDFVQVSKLALVHTRQDNMDFVDRVSAALGGGGARPGVSYDSLLKFTDLSPRVQQHLVQVRGLVRDLCVRTVLCELCPSIPRG